MQLSWRELCRSQIIQWLNDRATHFIARKKIIIIITAKKKDMGMTYPLFVFMHLVVMMCIT